MNKFAHTGQAELEDERARDKITDMHVRTNPHALSQVEADAGSNLFVVD